MGRTSGRDLKQGLASAPTGSVVATLRQTRMDHGIPYFKRKRKNRGKRTHRKNRYNNSFDEKNNTKTSGQNIQ